MAAVCEIFSVTDLSTPKWITAPKVDFDLHHTEEKHTYSLTHTADYFQKLLKAVLHLYYS